jgi:hypothetical protein
VITLVVVVTAGKKMQITMNKRLKLKIEIHNNASWTPDSKRIIIKTLKPNYDKSLKSSK